MLAKKGNLIVIRVLISILLLAFITPLSADAEDLSVSVAVEPKLTYDYVGGYDGYTGFSDGLAAVKKAGVGWGFIDASGKEVIPCKYTSVYSFYDGLAMFSVSSDSWTIKYGIIDKTGKVVVPAKYDSFKSYSNKVINGVSFDVLFYEGIAVVHNDGKYGYVDNSGREITSCKYDYAYNFSDGRAVVKLNGKYGYIDTTGNEVVPLKYSDAKSFSNGYASVNSGKWGLIDKDGNEVVPPKYEQLYNFDEGLAIVNAGGGFPTDNFDFGGTVIVPFQGGKYGFIDTNGNEVIPVQYDFLSGFSNGLSAARINDKWGYIDTSGRQVIAPKYDYATSFDENGMAQVKLNNKYGFIDQNDNIIVPIKYDRVDDFQDGIAGVCINDKYGFVDLTGKEVIPLKYFYKYANGPYFKEGVAEISTENKWFYINKTGEEVVLPRGYRWAGQYAEGLCKVNDDNGRYGFVDITGKVIVQPQYYSATNFFGGLSLVEKQGKYGILKLGNTAKPISAAVFVDGEEVTFEAYGINGNNYFKLRDIAMALSSSSGKQFDVSWNAEKNSVNLISGKAYTPVGGELGRQTSQMTKDALPTASKFDLDGKEINMTVYLIENNNYIKLRDLGKALNFGVIWDGAANTILIDTSIQYTE